ncbi:MAG TPA: GntR family transcriptional regulator [Bacillales bacterium]|nr:GntR family transcriptional regulator [Bacillales bacterium]
MEKVEQTPVRERIASILREEILSGNLEPGQRLVETELCEDLGISRTPLREAIRMLEVEGMVESIPNRGSRVVMITIEDIQDIYEIRKCLEGMAAKKSAPRMTAATLEKLKRIQKKLLEVMNKEDWNQADLLNREFHSTLYNAGTNRRLISLVEQFNSIGRFIRMSAFSIPGRAEEVLKEHEAILQALEEGDAAKVGALVEYNLQAGEDVLLKKLKQEKGSKN